MTLADDPSVLLFDVGGVLVQLSGVEDILGWLGHRLTEPQFWHRWLQSPSVRAFETGRLDTEAFAQGVCDEFELPVAPGTFLDSFARWPTGLFPGALELLDRVPARFQRALLSNSNTLHWPRILGEMQLGSRFEAPRRFVSHLMGVIKPDRGAFEHVVESLGCRPAQVLFLDDNRLNIEAAQSLGMCAFHVRGAAEAGRALAEAGVLNG